MPQISWPEPFTVKMPPLALALPTSAGLPMSPAVQGEGREGAEDDPRVTFAKLAVAVLLATWLVTARPT